MTTRAEFVSQARLWLGTRWQHQGRAIGAGIDCVGLVLETCRAVGPVSARDLDAIEVEINGYGRQPYGSKLRKFCDMHMLRISFKDVQIGDIVLMRFETDPQHLGIISAHSYENGLTILHAHALARKAVEHRMDSVWRDRVVQYYAPAFEY